MSGEQPPIPPIVDLRRWREMRSRRNRKGAPPQVPPKRLRRSLSDPRKIQRSLFIGRYRMLLLLGGSFVLILGAVILVLLLAGAFGG